MPSGRYSTFQTLPGAAACLPDCVSQAGPAIISLWQALSRYARAGQAGIRAAWPRFGMAGTNTAVIPSVCDARPTAWQRQADGDLCSFNARTSG
jgi:hypothetical protein